MPNLRKHLARNLLLYLAIGLVFAFGIYLFRLNAIPSRQSTDEGFYLSVARLLHLGYLFESIFLDQPPFLVWLVSLAFGVGGDSLFVGRLLIVAFAMISLAALARFTRLLAAPFATPFVLVLLGATPFFVRYSREVLGEVPMIAFLLLSLIALIEYTVKRRALWLVASPVCFALALAIKPLVFGFGIVVLIVLWFGAGKPSTIRPTIRRRLVEIVLFGLICGAVLIPALELYRVDWFLQDVMGLHLKENDIYLGQAQERIRFFLTMMQSNVALTLLAIPGIAASARKNFTLTVAVCVALLATLAVIFMLPPFDHHYLLFVPFLAFFAGIGIWQAIELLLGLFAVHTRKVGVQRQPRRLLLLYLGVFVGCLAAALVSVPALAIQDKNLLLHSNELLRQRVEFVASQLPTGSFVMGDDPSLIYLSGNVLPPCGAVMVYSRDFEIIPDSVGRLQTCLQEQPIQAILVSGGYRQVPGLIESFQDRFPTVVDGPGVMIYRKKRAPTEKPLPL